MNFNFETIPNFSLFKIFQNFYILNLEIQISPINFDKL